MGCVLLRLQLPRMAVQLSRSASAFPAGEHWLLKQANILQK